MQTKRTILLSLLGLALFFLPQWGAHGFDSLGATFMDEEEAAAAAGSAGTYQVQKGDTLWNLAGRFHNDRFAWPMLWSLNPHITNPNWIYPGDLIRIRDLDETTLDDLEAVTLRDKEPRETLVIDTRPSTIPGALGVDQFIRFGAFITDADLNAAGKIYASWEPKQYLSESDEVYATFERLPRIRPGDRWTITGQPERVTHPIHKTDLGYRVDILGILDVTSIEKEIAKGVIARSYLEIERGSLILPLMPIFRSVNPRDNDRDINAYIVASLTEADALGIGDTIFMDKGARDGMEVGNRFNIIRRADGLRKLKPAELEKLPYETVGQIMLVETRDFHSTGVITDAVQEIEIGDLCQTLLTN